MQLVQYLYVLNNPLCYTDPDGLMPVAILRNLRTMYLGGMTNQVLYSICATLNVGNPLLSMHEFAQIYASTRTEIFSRFNEIVLELPVYNPETGGTKEVDIVGYYGISSVKEYGAIYEVKSQSKQYSAHSDATTYMDLLNTCSRNKKTYKETILFTLGPRITRQDGIVIYSFPDANGDIHQMCMDIYSVQEGTIIYNTYKRAGKKQVQRNVIQVFNIAKHYNIIEKEREQAKGQAAGQLTTATGKTWTTRMLEGLRPVVPSINTEKIIEVSGQVAIYGLLAFGLVVVGSVLASAGGGVALSVVMA